MMKNHIFNKIKQPLYLKAIFMMAIFTFVFLGLEYMFDNIVALGATQEQTVMFQNYILGSSTLGFILFSYFHKFFNQKTKKIYMCTISFLAIVSIIIMSQYFSLIITLVSGLFLFFILGLFGSQVYYYAMCIIQNDVHLGSIVGISYMLGIVLQFINDNFLRNEMIQVCVFSISILVISLFIIQDHQEYIYLNQLQTKQNYVNKGTGILLVIIIAFMTFVFSSLDNAVTLVHASGQVDIGQWPRVFLALSGLSAGFLFDFQQRKYMDLIMYCIMMLSTLCIFVIYFGGSFLVGLLVFYISAGFFAVYFTTCFLELAYYTKRPQLWAGMGRAVNNITAALMTTVSLALLSIDNVLIKIIVFLILFVVVSIMMFIYSSKRKSIINIKPNQQEQLLQLSQQYVLTQREQDVFNLLVNTDDSLQEIADQLFISRRTLERHISSIYQKTDTKTRIGLIHLFHNQYR